jgi:hypothetical protein
LRSAFYADLGAASASEPGSARPFSPLLSGDIGLDFLFGGGRAFPFCPPFSCILGFSLGAWGFGGVSGFTAGGEPFAWTGLRVVVLSSHAYLRLSRDFRQFSCYVEAGPIAGTPLGYWLQESMAGVGASSFLASRIEDFGFAGAGASLGVAYNAPAWNLGLQLRGELALSDLAGKGGALGARLGGAGKLGLALYSRVPLGSFK